jgi:hypothetical protein
VPFPTIVLMINKRIAFVNKILRKGGREKGGGGLEIMRFWYWVMLRPQIGKVIMAKNAEFNATTGQTYPVSIRNLDAGILK